jgi:hypothetical protein
VSSFKRLLEQSKALEDEIVITRSTVNDASIKNSNAQSDLQTDLMAMSLACSGIGDNDLLDMSVPKTRLRLNLNSSGTNMPAVGDMLLFFRSKDDKFLAYGFSRVELDQRTIQDLNMSLKEEEEANIQVLVGRVERIRSTSQSCSIFADIVSVYD